MPTPGRPKNTSNIFRGYCTRYPFFLYISTVINQPTKTMSDYRTQILQDQNEKISKLATIIGRYKGGMSVFSDHISFLALNSKDLSQDARYELCKVADMMNKLVTENEALWNEAYGITGKPAETAELERA